MATKHVKETLGQFQDWKYFSLLEEKTESGDDKKVKNEDMKDGMDSIKKLRDNLNRFETAAGGKILKYKEFWEENQEASSEFDGEGEIYKLWDSDYVAGVLNLPDEALSDDELNSQIANVDDEDDEEGEEKEGKDEEDKDEEDEEKEGEDEEDKDEDEDEDEEDDKDEDEDKDEEEDEELEEGNAFSGAVKKAKDKKKKDFKFKGKKFPVKESLNMDSEDFLLESKEELNLDPKSVMERYLKLFEAEEAEEDEGELPAEDVTTPDEESGEEKEETNKDEFSGFNLGDNDLDGDGKDDETGEDVEVEDGEAIELEGDLDGDGEVEGGMEFAGEGETNEYFVIYDMAGSDRDEVFRTDDPKVIQEFKDFFENEFKATIKAQIQAFKQAQEEKKAEAEAKAKEEIRKQRKEKLDKFLKEDFDADRYEEPFVLDGPFVSGDGDLYDDDEEVMGDFGSEDWDEDDDFDIWKEDLIEILVKEYKFQYDEAAEIVDEHNPEEAFESGIPVEDVAAGIYDSL